MQSAPSVGVATGASTRSAVPTVQGSPVIHTGLSLYTCDPWAVTPAPEEISVFTDDGTLDLMEDSHDPR